MTFTGISKKWRVCWYLIFRRAAREEEDDGQDEGWTHGGRHSENGGGSGQGEALTTATAKSSTVDGIINFDIKYQSFIVVSCTTFHEDDEADLGGIKWD